MISLNLLPDLKKDLLRVRRERNLVISFSVIIIIVSIVVLLLLFGALGAAKIVESATRGNIEDNEKQLKKAQNTQQLNKYLTIQNQLKQITGLKSEQEIYSRLFDYLMQLNPASPNNVSISSATLSNEEGAITLHLEGSVANFAALNVYKSTLQKAMLIYEIKSTDSSDSSDSKDSATKKEANKENLFESVDVLDSSLSENGNESTAVFTMQLVFNVNAFSASASNPTLEVPKETTSDGDRNAPTFDNEGATDSSQSTDKSKTTEGGQGE